MSSASSAPAASSIPPKKVVVPKVWKRPHSTIYGKNVEFGSSLYSDKIGEINGRKFNSELPWTLRNLGTTSSSGSYTSQGYLSNRFSDSNSSSVAAAAPTGSARIGLALDVDQPVSSLEQSLMAEKLTSSGLSYSQLLELTNPARIANSRGRGESARVHASSNKPSRSNVDFYEKYGNFDREIADMTNNSILMNEPLLSRKTFDNFLDFDPELGLFLPNSSGSSSSNSSSTSKDQRKSSSRMDINTSFVCPMLMPPTTTTITPNNFQYYCDVDKNLTRSPSPAFNQTNNTYSNENKTNNTVNNNNNYNYKNLPAFKQKFRISSSPYGQSADGRKLSLGSINPHSYRPSLPQKTTTAHASDGDEIEFHDRSSPFYTDR